MYTLDRAIRDNKEFLKEIITEFEEELNNKDFKTIYKDISSRYDYIFTISFTALLLKNNINPLEYMNEVPDCFAKALDIEKFRIPANVTSIGYWAFFGCKSLSSIEIPDGVTFIGGSAFWGCKKLREIVIPKSVTIIGGNAFCGCKSLSSIEIPKSVTIIGDAAFEDCVNLSSITIPDSVTNIYPDTFHGCLSLTKITIPNSVTSIGYTAFKDCESLTDVYYEGSEEDWKKIKINPHNKELLKANIHYNS